MLLDQLSLLTAIGFSCAAMTLTLIISWIGSRKDRYLLSWSIGLMLCVFGTITYGMIVERYSIAIHAVSFIVTLAGCGYIYLGALQFRAQGLPTLPVAILTLTLSAATGIAFLLGYSGVGAIFGNLGIGVLLGLSGYQYWAGRQEARLPMIANAWLYAMAAISFALCSLVMIVQSDWILTARPENWAEELNAIIVIIGLTCIGATSLTLNQSRWTRHHRDEARTDALTGLLNRRALFDTLSGTHLPPGAAVIMFDLDHFKAINDRHGHAVGDTVLGAFGRLMQAGIRSNDLAARLGGEEFCIVLRDLTRQSAVSVAERIRSNFEHTAIDSADGTTATTVSAGVAISGIDGEVFEAVLNRADEALYAAKSAGRNRVHAPAPRLVA